MASEPAIRAALGAAGEAVRQAVIKPSCRWRGTGCELPPCHCSRVAAAAAVAEFLHSIERTTILVGSVHQAAIYMMLAVAVEAEARFSSD